MRKFGHRKMRIIFIGNQQDLAERLANLFSEENKENREFSFEFGVIQNGSRALQNFERLHPDLVLLDCQCESPSAIEICEQIRDKQNERHVGVIFIDKNEEHQKSVVECLEIGGDDWIDSEKSDRLGGKAVYPAVA